MPRLIRADRQSSSRSTQSKPAKRQPVRVAALRLFQGTEMTPYSFVTIDCPDTGRPITVAKNTRDDPIGQLYVTNRISQHQRAAAEAYQHDVEALSGNLRAPSRGPADVAGWRGRPARRRDRKARNRV